MKFKISLLLLLVSFAPALCHADSLYLGAWSKHAEKRDGGYNEVNHLAAYSTENGYTAGYFKNSFDRDTILLTKRWSQQSENLRGSIHLGTTYGYDKCNRDAFDEVTDRQRWCPVAAIEASYTKYWIKPTVLFMGKAFVFTFNIEI